MNDEESESFWDYNCPKYVDFNNLASYEDGADEWFDLIPDDNTVHGGNENKENDPGRRKSEKRVFLKPGRVSVDCNKLKKRVSLPKPRRSCDMISTSSLHDNMKKVAKLKSDSKSIRVPLKPSEYQRTAITIPQPFKLSEAKKKDIVTTTFRSTAEQVIAFQRKTPTRFHSGRRKSASLSKPAIPVVPLKPTVPKTPNLQTRYRSRPPTAVSKEEQENLELEEIRKKQFKAKPLDKKILVEKTGIKKVEMKEPTRPQPFHLSSGNKAATLKKSASLDKINKEFHARPIPQGMFERPLGLGPAKQIPLTVPESPCWNFAKPRRRSRSANDVEVPKETPCVSKLTLQVAPKRDVSGIPNKVKKEKRITIIEPFSFDDKDRSRLKKKEETIKDVIEQEKKLHEFRAQRMPDLNVIKIPEKKVRPATEIQPFAFIKDGSRSEKSKQEIIKDDASKIEAMKFKAGPNKVIFQPPFIPEKSKKPLTHVREFELKTDIRAVQRDDYDERRKEKEAELEALRLEQKHQQEQRENEMLIGLRKAAEHKANPIRKYKTVIIKQSDLPLTVPETPCFNKRK